MEAAEAPEDRVDDPDDELFEAEGFDATAFLNERFPDGA
jgi:hypothetical protein